MLVAPLPRLVRALLLLGAELARCFEKQGIPLPPWRHADAITTKYDAVSSVVVHGSGEASAAAAAGGPGPAAPQVAAAAAARKQQRDRQQLERVHVRLARLGVVSDLPAPLPPSTSPSSGGTPTTGADKGAVDSPRSVLEVRRPVLPGFLPCPARKTGALCTAPWQAAPCCEHGGDLFRRLVLLHQQSAHAQPFLFPPCAGC